MLYVSYYDSPIGKITLGAREDVLVGAWFEGQKYYMDKIIEDFEEKKDLPVLDQAEYWAGSVFCRAGFGSGRTSSCTCRK